MCSANSHTIQDPSQPRAHPCVMELPLMKKHDGGVLRESPFLTFTPEGRDTGAYCYTYGSGRWRLLGHREKGSQTTGEQRPWLKGSLVLGDAVESLWCGYEEREMEMNNMTPGKKTPCTSGWTFRNRRFWQGRAWGAQEDGLLLVRSMGLLGGLMWFMEPPGREDWREPYVKGGAGYSVGYMGRGRIDPR